MTRAEPWRPKRLEKNRRFRYQVGRDANALGGAATRSVAVRRSPRLDRRGLVRSAIECRARVGSICNRSASPASMIPAARLRDAQIAGSSLSGEPPFICACGADLVAAQVTF